MLISIHGSILGINALLLDQTRGTIEATNVTVFDLTHFQKLLGIFLQRTWEEEV